MSDTDETTVKIQSYAGAVERAAPQDNLTEEQNNALELVKRSAQLEEEKKKSLEHLQTIDRLQDSLKQEQSRNAEMAKKMAALEGQVKGIAALEAGVRKSIELEARVRELSAALAKISDIAAAGEAD